MIDALLADPKSAYNVTRYYDRDSSFAGHTFLGLAPNEAYAISPADLLAVTVLDVNPGAVAARELLPGGRHAVHVSALLARIPLNVPLWDASDADLAWSYELWRLLRKVERIGATTAGKLLARKRPELVPIVDEVVRERFACKPGTYWTTIREVLRDTDRRKRIAILHDDIPVLRLLDTLIWMDGR